VSIGITLGSFLEKENANGSKHRNDNLESGSIRRNSKVFPGKIIPGGKGDAAQIDQHHRTAASVSTTAVPCNVRKCL
jgi:hypothetical protein